MTPDGEGFPASADNGPSHYCLKCQAIFVTIRDFVVVFFIYVMMIVNGDGVE